MSKSRGWRLAIWSHRSETRYGRRSPMRCPMESYSNMHLKMKSEWTWRQHYRPPLQLDHRTRRARPTRDGNQAGCARGDASTVRREGGKATKTNSSPSGPAESTSYAQFDPYANFTPSPAAQDGRTTVDAAADGEKARTRRRTFALCTRTPQPRYRTLGKATDVFRSLAYIRLAGICYRDIKTGQPGHG